MKLLVTGANGLLGSKIIEEAEGDKNIQLIATSKGANRYGERAGVIYREMDISDREQVSAVFDEIKPDVVIHTAALTNVDECELNQELSEKINVEAVQILLESAARNSSFFVHLSTDFIFDGSHGPLTEEEVPGPVNFYGECKLRAEELVKQYPFGWSILRTVLVYGISPHLSRSNIILWVKSSLESGKTIQVVDDQYRTPTLAEDLAIGCLLVAKGRNEGVFNISGSDFLTPYEMAIQTAEFFNLDKGLIEKTDSSKFRQPARRPLRTGFVIEKAKKVLGYQPRTFKEGIALLSTQLK